MASLCTLLLLFLTCFSSVLGSIITNNITASHFLRYPETITSNNALFQFGFFNPTSSTNYYVGIWYTNKDSDSDVHQVIWIANRDNPLNDSSGVLIISEDGNLQLLNGKNKTFWTSNISSKNGANSIAQIQDTGNLALLSSVTGSTIWESFDHPTDSMLPLMKLSVDQRLKKDRKLVSWRSDSDPSRGRFTLGIHPSNPFELFIWDDDERPYWRTGPWVGNSFIGMALRPSVLLDRFSDANDNQGKLGFTLLIPAKPSNLEYYVLNYDGIVVRKDWNDETRKWVTVWKSYSSECDVYGKCGEFGVCNPKKTRICDCLKGFVPNNVEEWKRGNWSSGCVRRTPLKCGAAEGRVDGFLKLRNMKVPVGAELLPSNGEDDCERQCLGKCSCLAYTFIDSGFVCMIWNRSLIDIQDFFSPGADLFIRLAHSELDKTSKWKMILIVVLITMGITTFAIMYCLWRWRGRHSARNAVTDAPTNNDMSEPCASLKEFKDLPLTFEKLLVATNNFQENYKLGQGGFGPVYKGKLEDGQEIAVKRLSRSSDQGVQEFMNEVLLISKLQHRNLVRLLGCCVEGEEKMLVYEYMSNKSLDALLFDSVHREVLDWKKRFNIIDGICRGLLYLHRDSRLKVIHRDLKASNILLDEDFNPKISDFGTARIFGHEEDQASTQRIVGTLGYMSPEYAMEGRFSEKSDVYSFGVLLLEIISGRRNKSFDKDECLSLIGYAWKLWSEDDILSLVDPTISNPCFQTEIWRCIQIGLLCVQVFPENRPTISDVISMLRCEIAELPYPMQPGFLLKRFSTRREVAPNSQFSVNLVSLTCINGR